MIDFVRLLLILPLFYLIRSVIFAAIIYAPTTFNERIRQLAVFYGAGIVIYSMLTNGSFAKYWVKWLAIMQRPSPTSC